MNNSVNKEYRYLYFFKEMEEIYQQTFSNLADHYGNYINTLGIVDGKTLYTKHDFNTHCINIYKIIDQFFKESFGFLTPDKNTKNIFKLYLAVLFHDVGMTNFNMRRDNHSRRSEEYVRKEWENKFCIAFFENKQYIK